MMSRNPDVLFMTEYIKNVLYFATVRQGKVLKSTTDVHYFCTDSELVYENYYSDFGPLNLGCVFKYCKVLNEKLKLYLNKQSIVHYTSADPKRKANAAFLLGCYGVLYLSLTPKEALKPLTIYGQTYRPFQDATQGDSMYTITLMDCLLAIRKAREVGFFNFQDFNYEEYERLDKIQGGDLNWIIPGKFLAFIGPVDYSVSLYHPPEMYIDYFTENNVKIVIRLNKRMYDGNVFNKAGILHYDLFFPDGSCPPRHILFKFLQISEESDGAIAVHCKAGLGRTGSLIGCYLIKHYRMTAHEAIGWMRICRPGSVIGHQQSWLEQLEPWLLKQGNLYRRRTFQDAEKFPIHEYGVYSITEKTRRQKPIVFRKSPSPSPPPPIQRQTRSEIAPTLRPQASKLREEKPQSSEKSEDEIFITACDLTSNASSATVSLTQMKGCVIKNTTITEHYDENDPYLALGKMPIWKRLLCCEPCLETLWVMAVHCAKVTPHYRCCEFFDWTAPNKITAASEKEQYEWRVKAPKLHASQKISLRPPTPSPLLMMQKELGGDLPSSGGVRRGFAAGEPRNTARPIMRSPSRANHISRPQVQHSREKPEEHHSPDSRKNDSHPRVVPVTMYTTSQGPAIKTLSEARTFLMKTSLYKDQRDKQLNSTLTVAPHTYRQQTYVTERPQLVPNVPSTFATVPRAPAPPQHRRRLGRSPSPSPSPSPTRGADHSRATNTMPLERLRKDASKSTLREALSRLRLTTTRDGSVGAGSLGARRDAPSPATRRAPSVRSDERPLATQGDMLNSIKFQRRIREMMTKPTSVSVDKPNPPSRPSPNVHQHTISRASGILADYCTQRDKSMSSSSKGFCSPQRPTSPKGRTRQAQVAQHYFY